MEYYRSYITSRNSWDFVGMYSETTAVIGVLLFHAMEQ